MQPDGAKGDSILEPDVAPTARATPVERGNAPPDIDKTGDAMATLRSVSLGIWILAVLSLTYTIYFAREFLLPRAVSFASQCGRQESVSPSYPIAKSLEKA